VANPEEASGDAQALARACLMGRIRELRNLRFPAAISAIVTDRLSKIRKARAKRFRAAIRCGMNRESHETAAKLELSVRGPPAA
jgi:hypothetical protein